MASQSSFRAGFTRALLTVLGLAVFGASGCVTVKPEDREFLANPAMTFGAHGASASQEHHVLDNREGSTGGGGVTGGGCGCN